MGIDTIFDANNWPERSSPFWAFVFFVFGSMVGSFLNVCIYRMPLGLSIVSPPSHCPHCKHAIPWYLNIPLVTWLWLRGKCAKCGAPISSRYFLVELLTALLFLTCWLGYSKQSVWLALIYCLFVSGLIVSTFIDFEHFIIPDEITLGGIVAGFLCSLGVPLLQDEKLPGAAMVGSFKGIIVGWGLVLAILWLGKLLFGKQKVKLPGPTLLVFGETELHLPEYSIAYGEMLYRKTDAIQIEADRVELVDRCYRAGKVRLSKQKLEIGGDTFDPEQVYHMEVVATSLMLPREAMGFGDVKFMSAIGAFLGWPATLFCLAASSFVGAAVGITLIILGRPTSKVPYGPYIALAALLWLFGGKTLVEIWLGL